MKPLRQLTDNTFVYESQANVGVCRLDGRDVCLIDCGSSEKDAAAVLNLCRENGWRVHAVFVTHFHADHTFGAAYLQKETGCPIFADDVTAAVLRNPLLNTSILYGAFPPETLRMPFFLSEASEARELDGNLPAGFETVAVPGHALSMTAFRTPDGVWFLGDAVVSEWTLQRFSLTSLYDVRTYLHTLTVLESLQGVCFVPAHASPTDRIGELVAANRASCLGNCRKILALCRQKQSEDDLLAAFLNEAGRQLTPLSDSVVRCALRAYLSYLADEGTLQHVCENNRGFYVTNQKTEG